jgi:DNA-binding phage protein
MTRSVSAGLRRALKQRDRAVELRREAMRDFAYWVTRARGEGVAMEQIARETGYTRKQLYNIL